MSGARHARGGAMRMLRAVPDLRVAIALLFACALAAPRAPLVYHHHAGGAHAHVHAGAALGDATAVGAAAHHVESDTRGRPALGRATGATNGHTHHQDRYHAAVAPAVAGLTAAAPLVPVPAPDAGSAPTRATARASARAPPRSPLA